MNQVLRQSLRSGCKYQMGPPRSNRRELVTVEFCHEADELIIVTSRGRTRLDEIHSSIVFEEYTVGPDANASTRDQLIAIEQRAAAAREVLEACERDALNILETSPNSDLADVALRWIRDGYGSVDQVLVEAGK